MTAGDDDGDRRAAAYSDRRRMPAVLGAVVAVAMLVLNLGALVWGAARVTASVDQLRGSTEKLGVVTEKIHDAQLELDGRVKVLEDRDSRGRTIH